jgi:hypothetical protein
VGPRAGLDTEAKGRIRLPLLGIEPRSPGRPVRSQTLYYLGSHLLVWGGDNSERNIITVSPFCPEMLPMFVSLLICLYYISSSSSLAPNWNIRPLVGFPNLI